MKKQLLIFGSGDLAQLAGHYFSTGTEYEVAGYVLHKEFIKEASFESKPVIAYEELELLYPSSAFMIFIAVGYSKLNARRELLYHEIKSKGYKLASYISPHCTYLAAEAPGDNTFIFEDNTIQPFVSIGSNVIIWSGNHIGHHSRIDDHNFISSHVVISGHCHVKSNCFLGVNATIGNNVVIEKKCIVGAGSIITSKTDEGGVYVPAKTIKLPKSSSLVNL